jgi:hypothetical protein
VLPNTRSVSDTTAEYTAPSSQQPRSTPGAHDALGLSRRGFLNAAGLGAVSAGGLAAACNRPGAGTAGPHRGRRRRAPAGRDLADTVLEAFKTREEHWNE